MKTDEQRFPADGRGILCGHNFPPRQCPYAKCGYRETLERLEKCEAEMREAIHMLECGNVTGIALAAKKRLTEALAARAALETK